MGSKANHKVTDEKRKLVRGLAMAGYTDVTIAEHVEVTASTLKKYYADDLHFARYRCNGSVVSALYKSAIEGSVSAQIFWCKARLGWKETDFTDAADKLMDYVINAKSMTLEEWKAKHGKKKPS